MKLSSEESWFDLFSGSIDHEWYHVNIEDEIWKNGYFPNTNSVILFSADINQISYQRNVYNAFDLVGDIGGLWDGLNLFYYFFAFIGSFNHMTILISKVYKLNENE